MVGRVENRIGAERKATVSLVAKTKFTVSRGFLAGLRNGFERNSILPHLLYRGSLGNMILRDKPAEIIMDYLRSQKVSVAKHEEAFIIDFVVPGLDKRVKGPRNDVGRFLETINANFVGRLLRSARDAK
jgi:hypothetical protein